LSTKTPLLEEVQQPKKSPKSPGNALSNKLLTSRFIFQLFFEKFTAGAAQRIIGFWKPQFVQFLLNNQLIHQ